MESPISDSIHVADRDEPELDIVRYDGPDAQWDNFVRGAEGSTFCHLGAWREVMRGVLGHECPYLVASEADGSWVGVLPLVRVRSRLFGHYLLSMPFLNYGGPLGSLRARQALGREAVQIARERGVDLLEVRARGFVPEPPLERVDRKVTVVLALPPDAETLWKDHLKSKVRSQVRRPMKEGMTARFGSDQIEPFYEVFAENMRDLGTPVLPKELFLRMGTHLEGVVEFGCVYLEDQPVAGGCGFVWNSEFEITWASALREHSRKAPNMLLYWSFMERMIDKGVETFNFGRCTPGGGTHRFKLQWGGRDEPLPWGQWSDEGRSETPNPERPAFRAATKLWSRLPLPIANRLGPMISPWLP